MVGRNLGQVDFEQPSYQDSTDRHFQNRTVLRNARSGQIKVIKNGWRWSLFLFPGIAPFVNRLPLWGAICWVPPILFLFIQDFRFLDYLEFQSGLQTIVGIVLGIWGAELSVKNLLKNGWDRIDPNSLSEQEVLLYKLRQSNKVLLGVAAYLAARIGLKALNVVANLGGTFIDGWHGRPRSTGNPQLDVAIAEENLAKAELRLSSGSGSYKDVAEARRIVASHKQKLYR
jgi:hypothetical protein